MEFILGEEFAEAFFVVGTAIVTFVVWRGYKTGKFSPWLAWLTVLIFVGYATAFLGNHYLNGEMSEHVDRVPYYALIASIHGTISLWAIVQACAVFVFAERSFGRGVNYFQLHRKTSLLLVALWPLALLSGFLL